jgi:hypothetical protein
MPLTTYHAAASGTYVPVFQDLVTGTFASVNLAANQTVYYDPHSSAAYRLKVSYLVNKSSLLAGSGSVAAFPGTQNAWFIQGSGIPFSPNETGTDFE